jgi:hypothetical protein
MNLKRLLELSDDLRFQVRNPNPEKVQRIGAELVDLAGGGLPTWGAIAWRRAHRLDSAEDQAAGWKVKPVFAKPQLYRDVIRYIELCQGDSNWIRPDSFEIVPWVEQDAAVAQKMIELGRLEEMREPVHNQAEVDADTAELLRK